MSEPSIDVAVKQQVRAFYESVGWKQIGPGVYQNARYEDLRPVSREYIHRCHVRLGRYLPKSGRLFLDAGSGPIQYPEYLDYSHGFERRVCLDLSRLALREARQRAGAHGWYVVGDIARLPFRSGAFDGGASLHTVHHLPPGEQRVAFAELARSIRGGGAVAIVYSWGERAGVVRWTRPMVVVAQTMIRAYRRLRRRPVEGTEGESGSQALLQAPGSFTHKHDYDWVEANLRGLGKVDVYVWRSVTTAFLRALIHPFLLGRTVLRGIYAVEERAPRFLGRHGAYSTIVITVPAASPGEGMNA